MYLLLCTYGGQRPTCKSQFSLYVDLRIELRHRLGGNIFTPKPPIILLALFFFFFVKEIEYFFSHILKCCSARTQFERP